MLSDKAVAIRLSDLRTPAMRAFQRQELEASLRARYGAGFGVAS